MQSSIKISALILSIAMMSSIFANLTIIAEEKEESSIGWWTNWARDTNKNKIDDILEKELENYKGQSIKVFVDYATKPSNEDISKLEKFGKIDYIAKYIDAIVLEVQINKLKEITNLKNVVMIEYNLKLKIALDTSVPAIGIDEVWNKYKVKGEGIVIAVIDTGIDANHISLNDLDDNPNTNDPKVIAFYDVVNNAQEKNGTTTPYDDNGHGSHVSGIISGTGEGDPNYKYIGVAPKSKLVGIKVLSGDGSGFQEDAVRGIEWAIDNKEKFGINILSMSFGAITSFGVLNDGTSAVSRATDSAVKNGLTSIIAAGNSGPAPRTIAPPGDSKEGITVGNVDDDGNLQSSSSRGPAGTYLDSYIKPDVCAPGTDIYSVSANSGNGYESNSGTSMSAPHVSGLVGLMLNVNPTLTPYQIKEILHNTSDKKESYPFQGSPNNDYGWGVINPMEAVKNASQIIGSKPTISITSPKNFDIVSNIINIQGIASSNGNSIQYVEVKIDEKGKDESAWNKAEGTTNWQYLWDSSFFNGTYTIKARAYNGVYSEKAEINVFVDNSAPPTIKITSPKNNETISGKYNLTISTTGNVVSVKVKIDNNAEENANSSDNITWQYIIDTSKLSDGRHKITASAEDNKGKIATTFIYIEVKNEKIIIDKKPFIPGFTILYFIIALIFGLLIKKKR